jgi:N-methylhydantoinase B
MAENNKTVLYQCGQDAKAKTNTADPVTTEVIRSALQSAANQMCNTLTRTTFSPIVYEANDFCVALYDRNICMLSQAPTLPIFLGTMNFCIEAAIEGVGGVEALEPGDVILYNLPYGTGSHAQDAAIVMPIFQDDEIVGYSCNKAHWYDIGAKNPYCTDTEDLFQEGVMFPGVKLFSKGKKSEDIFRMVEANTRAPEFVIGDLHAQISAVRAGEVALLKIIKRFGKDTFGECVQRMFDHSEVLIRDFIEQLPDGRYEGGSTLDSDGIDLDKAIDYKVAVEIKGSTVRVDFSEVPDALGGPMNCPFPSTVSAARVVIGMMLGEGGAPTEGHFRSLEVLTRPGSIFHPLPPSPCFMYGWPLMNAMEAIFEVFSKMSGDLTVSGSGGDICYVAAYGIDDTTGEFFINGFSMPVGNGAQDGNDGSCKYVPALARSTLPSAELQEAKFPIIFTKWEFREDSCGPGKYRGGNGIIYEWELTNDARLISTYERTKTASWAQQGGLSGLPNKLEVEYPDGRVESMMKCTGLPVPKGTIIRQYTGGGGGYGLPEERDPTAVRKDLQEGFITEEHAREHYSHAF